MYRSPGISPVLLLALLASTLMVTLQDTPDDKISHIMNKASVPHDMRKSVAAHARDNTCAVLPVTQTKPCEDARAVMLRHPSHFHLHP